MVIKELSLLGSKLLKEVTQEVKYKNIIFLAHSENSILARKVPVIDFSKYKGWIPEKKDDLPTPIALNPKKIRSDFDKTPKGIDFSKISGRTFVRYLKLIIIGVDLNFKETKEEKTLNLIKTLTLLF